jgi:hypothetical protein
MARLPVSSGRNCPQLCVLRKSPKKSSSTSAMFVSPQLLSLENIRLLTRAVQKS